MVGAPFFEKVTVRLPPGAATGGIGGNEHEVIITAPGATMMPYVKSLKIDGKSIERPVLKHSQLVSARSIAFEMADTPQDWGDQRD